MGNCLNNKNKKSNEIILQKNIIYKDSCSICLEAINIAEKYQFSNKTVINYKHDDFIIMPCGNAFHNDCLLTYYNRNIENNLENKCPICRSQFIILNDKIVESRIKYDKNISENLQNKLNKYIQQKIENGEL